MITAAVKGPTGKSVFIEAEKVSFLGRLHGENNKCSTFIPCMVFRLSSWNDPWEKAPEILITFLILLGQSCLRRDWLAGHFPPWVIGWVGGQGHSSPARWHLAWSGHTPSGPTDSGQHSFDLQCGPVVMCLLLFRACPLTDLDLRKDGSLLSAYLDPTCRWGPWSGKA